MANEEHRPLTPQETVDLFIALQGIVKELPLIPEPSESIEFTPILVPGDKDVIKDAVKGCIVVSRESVENRPPVLAFTVYKSDYPRDLLDSILGEVEWSFVPQLPLVPTDVLSSDPDSLSVKVWGRSISVDQFLKFFQANSYTRIYPAAEANTLSHIQCQILAKAVTTVKAVKYLLDKQSLGGGWTYAPIAYDGVTYYLGLLKPNDHTTCVKLKNEGDVTLLEFFIGQNNAITFVGGDGSIDIEKTINILTEGVLVEKELPSNAGNYRDDVHNAFQLFRQGAVYKTAMALPGANGFKFYRNGLTGVLNLDCLLTERDYPFTLIIHDKNIQVFEGKIRNGEENTTHFTDHTRFTWSDLHNFLVNNEVPTPNDHPSRKAFDSLRSTSIWTTIKNVQDKGISAVKFAVGDLEGYLCRQKDTEDPIVLTADLITPSKRVPVLSVIVPEDHLTAVYPILSPNFKLDDLERFLVDLSSTYTTELPKISWDHLEMLDSIPKKSPAVPLDEQEPQFIDLRFIDVSDEWIQWYAKKHDTTLAHSYREGVKSMVRLQEQLDRRISIDGPRQNVTTKDPEPELIDRETADLSYQWVRWFMRAQGASEEGARRVGMSHVNALNLRVTATLFKATTPKEGQ